MVWAGCCNAFRACRWWIRAAAGRCGVQEVRARELDFCGHRLFMLHRTELRVGVEVMAVRAWDSMAPGRRPVGSVGRTWDKPGSQSQLRPARACCGRRRIGRVFRSAVGRASDWLWRWDGRSRNSGPSASRWAGHGAGSGARTRRPARSVRRVLIVVGAVFPAEGDRVSDRP